MGVRKRNFDVVIAPALPILTDSNNPAKIYDIQPLKKHKNT
jgi:hypothetical protein